MTPREKALDLQKQYYGFDGPDYAISMALVCVDEILREIGDIDDGQTPMPYNYWKEVKQELKKL